MQWRIYALYESASGMVQSPNGLWEAVACTIGVKERRPPLLPTVSGFCKDEVSLYIERFGSSGACLVGITIQILLYDDDILLILDSLEGLQRHLNTLKVFC